MEKIKENIQGILLLGLFCGFFIMCLWGLGDARLPLLIAFALAYLFFPLIERIEKWGIRRDIAILSIFFLSTIINIGLLFILAPALLEEIKLFIDQFPVIADKIVQKIEGVFHFINSSFHLNLGLGEIKELVIGYSGRFGSELWGMLGKNYQSIASNALGVVNVFFNVALIPVFFFYLANDFEKIASTFQSLIPRRYLKSFEEFKNTTMSILNNYLRGQFVVALILTVLYSLGLMLTQVKFGFVIGLFAGFLSIIPYAGLIIGFGLALLMSFLYFDGMAVVFGVIAVFSIVQGLEGFVITPRLVGKSVGLSSFITILALIIGTNLLGVVGIFLAIPLGAVIKILLGKIEDTYHGLDFYRK
jgi:predicted PurR-regulated permease PerM